MHSWTFLTNHAHALIVIARNSGARYSDVAREVGITERAAARILRDLATEGYISVERVGRRNYYTIHRDRPLRHPLEQHRSIGDLLGLLGERAGEPSRRV